MRHIIALCLLLTLAYGLMACGPTIYIKPGHGDSEFQADLFDCESKVGAMYGGRNQMEPGIAIIAYQDIKRCIQTKGWRVATAEQVKAGRQR